MVALLRAHLQNQFWLTCFYEQLFSKFEEQIILLLYKLGGEKKIQNFLIGFYKAIVTLVLKLDNTSTVKKATNHFPFCAVRRY